MSHMDLKYLRAQAQGPGNTQLVSIKATPTSNQGYWKELVYGKPQRWLLFSPRWLPSYYLKLYATASWLCLNRSFETKQGKHKP